MNRNRFLAGEKKPCLDPTDNDIWKVYGNKLYYRVEGFNGYFVYVDSHYMTNDSEEEDIAEIKNRRSNPVPSKILFRKWKEMNLQRVYHEQ